MEITIDPKFNQPELNQIEMHSFHNVMTVIFGELQFLETVLGDNTALSGSLALCDEFTSVMKDKAGSREFLLGWDGHKEYIMDEIKTAVAARQVNPEHLSLIQESITSIRKIFKVVDARVEELLTGERGPMEWMTMPAATVEDHLVDVLDAIAFHSRGRYGIVYDPRQKGENDYLVEISIKGGPDGIIRTPLFMLDALRDLTANARKYTKPGGRISCSFKMTENELELAVTDTGRGIPEKEIEKVVDYGFRGSNAAATETKGGGYGLTKAYYFCKKSGGRMWIDSQLGVGTTMRIIIPLERNE